MQKDIGHLIFKLVWNEIKQLFSGIDFSFQCVFVIHNVVGHLCPYPAMFFCNFLQFFFWDSGILPLNVRGMLSDKALIFVAAVSSVILVMF